MAPCQIVTIFSLERGPWFKMAGGGRHLGLLLRYRHNINNRYFGRSSIRNGVTNTSGTNYYLRNHHPRWLWRLRVARTSQTFEQYAFHNNALSYPYRRIAKLFDAVFLSFACRWPFSNDDDLQSSIELSVTKL